MIYIKEKRFALPKEQPEIARPVQYAGKNQR
jgi:hypothetical protein